MTSPVLEKRVLSSGPPVSKGKLATYIFPLFPSIFLFILFFGLMRSLFFEAFHTQQFFVTRWGDLDDYFFSTTRTYNSIGLSMT